MLSYQIKKVGFLFALCLLLTQIGFSQTEQLSPAQIQKLTEEVSRARAEIKAKGLEEAEVKERMREKGIDLDNIDPSTTDPDQVRSVFDQVVAELERKASEEDASVEEVIDEANNAPPDLGDEEAVADDAIEEVIEENELDVEEIEERIDEGQTIGEAVAEELAEETELEAAPAVIFGHHLFRDGIVEGIPFRNAIVPPSTYRMGVGDQVAISIFGVGVGTSKATIGSDGFIRPQGVRPIYLKGLTLERAKNLLAKTFRERYQFNNDQIEISLDVARTVNVGIVGEVFQPTNYTIPATNNAVNALSIAGGPTDIGSVRKIELIKADGQRKILDLYEYNLNPVIGSDYFLEYNDYILVPVAEKVVEISGAIRRPFRYELLESENLMKLIEYAAGLTSNAYTSNVQITRTQDEEVRIIDVNLKELQANGGDFELMNADVVNIRTTTRPLRNYVEITGDDAVDYPGRYELVQDMKISDLVEKANLREEARTDIVFLVRKARDGTLDYEQINLDSILADPNDATNLTLQSEDLIRVSTKSAYLNRGTVIVSGAVRQGTNEFPFDFNDRMTISDAVMISGGLSAGANEYGYIVRKNPDNLEESTNVSFNIKDIMNAPNSAIDLELRPFDEIVILSNSTFTETYDINVTGAVRKPGSFPFATGMKLRDVILRSGGLEEFADASAYVMRPDPSNPERVTYKIVNPKAAMEDPNSTSNIEILPRDTIQVLAMQTFTDEFYVRVQGEVRNPGEFKYDESLKLSDVLRMSGGLKKEAAANKIEIFRLQVDDNNPTQTVVAEFDLDRNLPIGGTNDTQLAPFDVVVVRRIPNFDPIQTVNITGEVKYPGVYALIGDNERIQSVIKRAGGTTYEAFVEGATLFREEDEIGYVVFDFERALSSKNSRDNIILKPGDVIEIPKQEDLVSLRGATNAPELLPDKYLQDGTIDVVYHKGKRAMFYIKKYAGGASENAKKSTITVEQPNGKLARTVDLGIFKIYPKVEKGALISVGSKPAREIEADQEPIQNEPVDWGEIVSNALAQVSAVLTVVLLIERTNN